MAVLQLHCFFVKKNSVQNVRHLNFCFQLADRDTENLLCRPVIIKILNLYFQLDKIPCFQY